MHPGAAALIAAGVPLLPDARLLFLLLFDALDNIRVKPAKFALALIGIALGTGAVIALLHIGGMARSEALRAFNTIGADFVTIRVPVDGRDKVAISASDVANIPLAAVGLVAAAPMIRSSTLVFEGRDQWPVDIVGTTPDLMPLLRLKLGEGRFISFLDGLEPFVVIGSAIADHLSAARGHRIAIGDRFRIGDQSFCIIGILAPQPPNPLVAVDPEQLVVVVLKAARRLVEQPRIETVAARLSPAEAVDEMSRAVSAYFRPRLRGADVHLAFLSDLIAGIGEQMRIYDVLLLSVGGISLSIGGIGIMNVLLMAVMERRAEVGLRSAIGASPHSIRLMFLMESIILSSVGSLLGLVAGIAVAWLLARQSGWTFEFAPWALPLAFGMAGTVGLFFGIYPAHRAASLPPVEALRHE